VAFDITGEITRVLRKVEISLFELGDEFLKFCLACAREGINLLAILEEEEGWHRADIVFCGELLILVNIDFEDDNTGVFLGNLFQDWSNQLARSAPGGKKVDNNQLVAGGTQLSVEVRLVLNLMDHFC